MTLWSAPSVPRSRTTWVQFRRRVRRLVLGHRRVLAALLAAVAVLAGLQAVRPAPERAGVGLGSDGADGVHATANARPATLGERLVAQHRGLTPLPVRFADAEMADLLEPGDRVTLLATDAQGVSGAGGAAAVVAGGVTVLQTAPRGRARTSTDRVTSEAAGRLIIVGVPASAAPAVSAAAVRSVLTYAWDR